MITRKLLLAGLVCASAALSGCKPAPGTAPYSINYTRGGENTSKPLRAELYIYKVGDQSRNGNFAYVGKPWVFEFPSYTYFRATDPGGGPQGSVVLHFDPEKMEPMHVSIRKRFGEYDKWPKGPVTDANGTSSNVFNWGVVNQIGIKISPVVLEDLKSGWPDVAPRNRPEWNKYLKMNSRKPANPDPNVPDIRNSNIMDPHGEACGATWYRGATTNPNDPDFRPEFVAQQIQKRGSRKIDGLEFSYYNLQAYVDDKKYGGINLWCNGTSKSCGQTVYLPKAKMFAVRMEYPWRYACQYREIADKVDALFAKHTISYPSVEGGLK